MKDWLVIPAKMASSPQWLAALLESALPLVASLPPKMKKPARRAKPRVVDEKMMAPQHAPRRLHWSVGRS